ncbi:phosphoenolpyruvate--protein phosphotransferase [Candidatus Akkermansia timonensis]|nr:phosphoenolpyruvate--protein phosphotransferase [Candidatus Akkermansia timonensis]
MIQEPISTEEIHLQGIPVSPGIALGKIRIQIKGSKEPVAYDIEPDEVDSELVRFHRALQTTAVQIRALRERMIQISGEKEAAIFDAHILLLQDKIILDQVRTELARRLQNVEHIFYVVMQNYMEVLRRVDDPYLRAKTADMEDIMQRVIDNLRSTEPPEEDEADEEEPEILVAYDLTPSDTAAVDASQIHGFATEIGSSVSHTAILARSMGIPAVVGLEQALLNVESHAPAILDGYKGVLILKPSTETVEYYKRLQVEKEKAYKALEALRDLPTVTRDGRSIRLSVNVEFPHEYSGIKEVGAEGVGLFRTEFFLLGNPSGMPDEEEQMHYYKKLAEGCAPPRRHLPHAGFRRRQAALRTARHSGTEPLPGLAGHPRFPEPSGTVQAAAPRHSARLRGHARLRHHVPDDFRLYGSNHRQAHPPGMPGRTGTGKNPLRAGLESGHHD